MMKPYEPWDYCKSIHCLATNKREGDYKNFCRNCRVYRMHQYLSDHSQILEAGSELERLVTVAELAYKSDQITVSQGGYAGDLARLIMLRLEG